MTETITISLRRGTRTQALNITGWKIGEWVETSKPGEKKRLIIDPRGKTYQDYLAEDGKHDLVEIKEKNEKNKLKEENKELKKAITAKDIQKEEKESPEKQLYDFVKEIGFEFCADQFGNAIGIHNNTYYEIKGGEFKNLVARRVFEEKGKVHNDSTWKKFVSVVESISQEDKKYFPLRCHNQNGRIYYDDGISVWEFYNGEHKVYVKTDKECPVIFRRYSHQEKALIEPNEEKASVLFKQITSMFNINDFKEEALVPLFNSTHPEPMKLFVGPPGAAKSTFSSIIKKLVDPDQVDRLTIPERNDINEFSIHRQHFYVILYDNIREFYKEQSDQLCMMITGGTGVKRALYTNGDLYISKGLPRILGNGLRPEPSEFNDLLDRTLIIDMARIEGSVPERKILDVVDEIIPKLRYACLRDLSKAIYDPVKDEEDLPRMSEYCLLGDSISKVWASEERFTPWFKNQMAISHAVGSDDPTMIVLKAYLEAHDLLLQQEEISMSSTQWRIRLYEWATEKQVVSDVYGEKETNKPIRPDYAALVKERKFPDNGTWMGRRFRDLTPLLHANGYKVEFDRSTLDRKIAVSKL